MQGYRPGMVRADLPDEQRRRQRDGGDAEAAPRRTFDAGGADADGSFSRGGVLWLFFVAAIASIF